jgi:hypothetical protein
LSVLDVARPCAGVIDIDKQVGTCIGRAAGAVPGDDLLGIEVVRQKNRGRSVVPGPVQPVGILLARNLRRRGQPPLWRCDDTIKTMAAVNFIGIETTTVCSVRSMGFSFFAGCVDPNTFRPATPRDA